MGTCRRPMSRQQCCIQIALVCPSPTAVLLVCLFLRVEEQQVLPGVCTHLPVQHVPVRTEERVADPLPRGGGRLHDSADQTEAAAGQSAGLQRLTKRLKLERKNWAFSWISRTCSGHAAQDASACVGLKRQQSSRRVRKRSQIIQEDHVGSSRRLTAPVALCELSLGSFGLLSFFPLSSE